ncbi:superoxide dismutase [Metabacillus idriensis]|uniref:superoxide dismutase n=1 Tax=Metabacillus idriensis TaxID=324768 RepID=UPI0009F67EE8|nr:superoxide dismutase [Metabacillus idriensis]
MKNDQQTDALSLLTWCKEAEEYVESLRDQVQIKEITAIKSQLLQLIEDLNSVDEETNAGPFFQRAHELHNQILNTLVDERTTEELNRALTVPIGRHKLPPLPYAYNALEPYISEEIMRLHHLKHHQSYVDGLNKAEKEMETARRNNDYKLIKHWEREAAFHGAGHYLHTIFWSIMAPHSGGKPGGQLLRAINESFGSFDSFKMHFTEAAKNVEAVGWAILVWSPRSHRLEILTAEKHQNLSQWDVIPLLVLDVWEHAYYLQYKNERPKYVENWWNVVNWKEVERRFNAASSLKWQPY